MNTARNPMWPVQSVALEHIRVEDRLRTVDAAFVELIAASLLDRGQDTPITVSTPNAAGDHELIAGAHRVAAAKQIGWTHITAVIFGGSALEGELLEVEENLMRRELSPLDRAVFLAKHKSLYQQLYPQAKRGGDRRPEQRPSIGLWSGSFADAVKDRLRLSKSTVNLSVKIAERLPRDIRVAIASTPIADSLKELKALSKLPPGDLLSVVDIIVERGMSSVAEALRLVRNLPPPTVNVDEQDYQRLLVAWTKASAVARQRFIAHLREAGHLEPPKPKGRKAAGAE